MAFYLTDCLYITCGVPQGSILQHLLFLIYVNDFEACALSSTVMMYADDTCIIACSHDFYPLVMQLSNDLNKAQLGLEANKLTVNAKKTMYIVIASQNKLNSGVDHDPVININNQSVEIMHSYKYLGIEIDGSLNLQAHVEIICKKVSAGFGALKRIRDFIPRRILLKIYATLVSWYFQCCSEVSGCVDKYLSHRLQKLQNRAGRSQSRITALEVMIL